MSGDDDGPSAVIGDTLSEEYLEFVLVDFLVDVDMADIFDFEFVEYFFVCFAELDEELAGEDSVFNVVLNFVDGNNKDGLFEVLGWVEL